MVFGLSPVPSLDAGGTTGAYPREFERQRDGSATGADDRQHRHSGASSGGRRERGLTKKVLAVQKVASRPGYILITNARGLPVRAEITGGEVSDYKGFDLLMDGELPPPGVPVADGGYDSGPVRRRIEEGGGTAVIPGRSTRRETIPVDDFIHALGNQIERCLNRLKNARGPATRYDKTAESHLGFIHIVAARLWMKTFVNESWSLRQLRIIWIIKILANRPVLDLLDGSINGEEGHEEPFPWHDGLAEAVFDLDFEAG